MQPLTRAAVYLAIRGMDQVQMMDYLLEIGLSQDQATDFIADHQHNTRILEKKPKDNTAFERMMERMRARCEGKHDQTGRTT